MSASSNRILSVPETCRLDDTPLRGYLVDVHAARVTDTPLHGYLVDVHAAGVTDTPIPAPLPAARVA